MVFIDWGEMGRRQAESRPVTPFANSVRRGICNLRQTNPAFRAILTGELPGGLNPYATGFWNEVCDDFQLPPGEDAPLGGQCATGYYVRVNAIRDSDGAQVGSPTNTTFYQGPISAIWFDPRTITGTGGTLLYPNALYVRDSTPNAQPRLAWSYPASSVPLRSYDYRILRIDGQPDTCGNPPPPPPPPPPPNNIFNIPVTINNQVINLDFELPSLDVQLWPNIDVDLNFNTQIGPINIRPGGIEVPDIPTIPNESSDVPVDYQQIADIVNTDGNTTRSGINQLNNVVDVRFDVVDTILDSILDRINECCQSESPQYLTERIATNSLGGRFVLPLRTVAVLIRATLPITANTPMQAPSGDSEAIYHWGSVAVNYETDYDGQRVPLQFGRTSLPVSERGRSITLVPHYGNRGTVDAIYRNDPL